MIGKLMGWIVTLIAKLIGLALMTLIVGVVSLAGYFYYKSDQPMQVAAAQRLAPGITYREFWQYQFDGWRIIDDAAVANGKNRSCVRVNAILVPPSFIFSIMQINFLRSHRGTHEAAELIKSLIGPVPPDNLLYGSIWNLPDAYWWYIENSTWDVWYSPLHRDFTCSIGAPHRPEAIKAINP